MTSLAIYLLPAVALAVFHFAAPAEEGSGLTGPLSRHNALRLLLRKRSLESALRAPPSLYPDMLESPMKRDNDGYWIWMPAHGYMPVPNDEVSEEQQRGQDRQGTILRYG
ncbi:hypothetical protein Btru_064475 [Bulinus truncatus]|nr:hypothetical protein Btru_064475 [Bulinus truncatus]